MSRIRDIANVIFPESSFHRDVALEGLAVVSTYLEIQNPTVAMTTLLGTTIALRAVSGYFGRRKDLQRFVEYRAEEL